MANVICLIQRSLYIDQSKAKEKCLIDNISSIDLMISKDIDGSTDWKIQPRAKFIFFQLFTWNSKNMWAQINYLNVYHE